jgi:hypothetical protein
MNFHKRGCQKADARKRNIRFHKISAKLFITLQASETKLCNRVYL